MQKIVVYGNSDKRPKLGFPTEADFNRYLKEELFAKENGRYHYTQRQKADIIVVSREGYAYGHLCVTDPEGELPNEADRKSYPPVKRVYVISKSVVYNNKVRLKDVGVLGIQFGKSISKDVFNEIQKLSKGGEEFSGA